MTTASLFEDPLTPALSTILSRSGPLDRPGLPRKFNQLIILRNRLIRGATVIGAERVFGQAADEADAEQSDPPSA